jgi:hypothetical protein
MINDRLMSLVSIASPSRYDACGADLLDFCRFPAGWLALAAEMRACALGAAWHPAGSLPANE